MCQICLKFATFAENKLRSAKQRIVYFMFCTAYSGRKNLE